MLWPGKFFSAVKTLLTEEGRRAILETEFADVEQRVNSNKAALLHARADVLGQITNNQIPVLVEIEGRKYIIDPSRTPNDPKVISPVEMAELKEKK